MRRTTRLAPSPTGALHLGNVRTFLINWALARQHRWKVVLRIEDLDTPRVKPETIALTTDLLAWLGLSWDEGPSLQSTFWNDHADAMRILARARLVYPSSIIRPGAQSAPQEGTGEARVGQEHRPEHVGGQFHDDSPAWRFITPDEGVLIEDQIAGPHTLHPCESVGDFVVWTRRPGATRGQAAYQLAVVVDDARAGVTEVVRGDDLLDSAARQTLLLRGLGVEPPDYWHVPLVRGKDGKRLAKRHGDTRLDVYRARGVSVERVIGLMGAWCGILPRERPEAMSLDAFVARFNVDTLCREAIVYDDRDEAFLLGGC